MNSDVVEADLASGKHDQARAAEAVGLLELADGQQRGARHVET